MMILSNEKILKMTVDFPKEFNEGINDNFVTLKFKPINIFYSGMGGSGVCGEVIKNLLKSKNIQVHINHSYDYFSNKFSGNDIHIFSSYSGNTEETLTAFRKAGNIENRYIITSGGKLEEIAMEQNLQVIKLKKGYQPRIIFPYTLGAILTFLNYFKMHQNVEPKMIVEHLKVIKNDSLVHEKLKQIAMSIEDNIVSIFNSFDITGVALRLSAQMNENSKLYTHISNFPECNHNEILAMEHMKKLPLKAIFIESKYDYDRIKIRMDIIRNMLKNNGIEIFCLKTDSVNYLDEVVSLIYMGDMLSVYTAINRGVVAGDIDEIEDLKKELKKR